MSRNGSSQPSSQGGVAYLTKVDNIYYDATDIPKEDVGGSNAANDPSTMVKVLENPYYGVDEFPKSGYKD